MLLGATSLEVYRKLVHEPGIELDAIAVDLGLAPEELERELEQLVSAGLLTSTPLTGLAAAAVNPTIGLALVAERAVWEVQQRAADLERAGRELALLLGEVARPADAAHLTSAVPQGSLLAQIELMLRQARSSIWIMLQDDWRDVRTSPHVAEQLALAPLRGVDVRVLVSEAGLQDMTQSAVVALGAGVSARAQDSLPASVVVIDGTAALMEDAQSLDRAGVLLRHGAGVAALSALFESVWAMAEPLPAVPGPEPSTDLDEGLAEHQVLAQLLAAGVTDESIARQLGVSVRTLTRQIAQMRETLGARTRFEAGVLAARRGLV